MLGVLSVHGVRPINVLALTMLIVSMAPPTNAQAMKTATVVPGPGAEFNVLTYNVAGLPAILSRSDPERNIPRISPLLNFYDLVLVQEDFAYHANLERGCRHPHRSPPLLPGPRVSLGDGLNRFSRMPFRNFERATWSDCNGRFSDGSDCLTAKGFSVAEHELLPGYSIDVYNVHMDSGTAALDLEAREKQVAQLVRTLRRRSKGRAVIVAGDTNLGPTEDKLYESLLSGGGLQDACRSLACTDSSLIDRVMYRGGLDIDLQAVRFQIDDRFVGDDGAPLSDHWAVGVVFKWTRRLTASQAPTAPPSDA